MARELAPVDITTIPGLQQLVDDVRATGKPRRLRHGGEDVAVLMPPAQRAPRRTRGSRPPATGRAKALSIAQQTAGMLQHYRKVPPPTPQEEKDAFARAVAAQVAESLGG